MFHNYKTNTMELTISNAGNCYYCKAEVDGISESFDFSDNPREVTLTREFDGSYSVHINNFLDEDEELVGLKKERLSKQLWKLKNDVIELVISTDLFDYTIDQILLKLGKNPLKEKLELLNVSLKEAEEVEDYSLCNIIKAEIISVKLGKDKNSRF